MELRKTIPLEAVCKLHKLLREPIHNRVELISYIDHTLQAL